MTDSTFYEDYDTEETRVVVAGRAYRLLVPRRLEPFLDPERPLADFPLWAKLWPAAVVLAEWVASQPPDPRQSVLEIGGGLGLTSIVAAACGHRVTFTEADPHALRFARASAALNLDAPLTVAELDWHRPHTAGRHHLVLGSEVVYREQDIAPLVRLFDGCLAPGGQIVLAGEPRRTTELFLARLRGRYEVRASRLHLRSPEQSVTVLRFHLRPHR